MCGEILPWQWTHEVVVRMLAPNSPSETTGLGGATVVQPNPAHVRIDLGRHLTNISQVRLTEYMVQNNATPAARNMWRISLAGSNLTDKATCNSQGTGTCIAIGDMTNPWHVQYDNPRLMSVDNKRGISFLDVNVTDEFGAPVSFTNITLFITFVMDTPDWSIEKVFQEDQNKIEWWRSNQNVGRFRF